MGFSTVKSLQEGQYFIINNNIFFGGDDPPYRKSRFASSRAQNEPVLKENS